MLMRHMDAGMGSFLILDGLELIPDKHYAVARGIDDKYLNLYKRYYHHMNPFARVKHIDPDHNVLTTEDVTTFKRLTATEYYNDFLKPQSIHHQLIIMLWSGNRVVGAASVYRPKEARGFSCREKTKAGLLAPFISVALVKNLAVARMDLQKNIIDAIVSEHPHQGIFIIDENFTAVYYNEKAVNLFKAAHIKSFNPIKPLGALPAELLNACKDYLLSSPDKPKDDVSIPGIRIDWYPKCRLIARVHKICGDHRRRFVMLSLEPEESIKTLNQILTDMKLTPREVEISNLLVKGLKNSDISEKLCISEYTVQNHIKSIYRKMMVKNRSGLIYRFLQLTSRENAFHNQSEN
jgi:DNA-binding CsgD family transcriptional regulator